jgi:hypothetical protein
MGNTPSRKPARVRLQALDGAGQTAAQADEPLGTPFYPPMVWTRGSIVTQQVTLSPRNHATVSPQLRLSVAEAASRRPLAIQEASVPIQNDALVLSMDAGTEQ